MIWYDTLGSNIKNWNMIWHDITQYDAILCLIKLHSTYRTMPIDVSHFHFALHNRHNISNNSDLWLRTMPFFTRRMSPCFMLHTLRSASPCFVCREVLPMFNFWRIAFCGALNMDRNSWDTDDENLTIWKKILTKDQIGITNFSHV